jgi:hypothetical protein
LHTPAIGMTTTATTAGRRGGEETQGAVRPAIGAVGVPAANMACRVNLGTPVSLKRSAVLANWSTDIGGAVGRGSSNNAGEAENVLGAIPGCGGSSSSVMSTRGRWQRQSPKHPPRPLPVLWPSLAREAMVRLSLSLLLSLLVGVSNPNIN